MVLIPHIILFILCSIVSGYFIHLLFLYAKKRNFFKSSGSEDQLNFISYNLIGGMIYRVIALKDGTKKFVYVSRGIKDIHGLTPEQVTADASLVYNQIHPEDRNMMMEAEKHAVDNMTHFDIETRITNIQGETRWVRLISHPTLLKNGTMAFDGIEIDITERKIAEEKLKNSEENYRNIINNIQDVFYRADMKGNLTMASPSIKKFLWFDTAEEYIGINTVENFYYNPSDRELLLDILEKDGVVTDFETILRRKDGSLFTASINSHYYYDKDGNIAGVEGIVKDITERKKAEELFSAAFHKNPCPMSITSLETGLAVEVNMSWLNTMEYEREDILGITPGEINLYRHPEDRNKLVDLLFKNGRVSGIEIDFVTRTGKTVTGLFSGDIVDVNGRKMLISAILDITERKKAENLFSAAFYENPCPMAITERDTGLIVELNNSWINTFEYKRSGILGKTITEVNVYSTSAERDKFDELLMKTGRVSGMEIVTVTSNGKKINGLIFAELFETGGKQIVLATLLDITEQQRLREESLRNALIFRTVFEASPYSIVINRVSDSKYVMVNPAFEKSTGYSAGEVIGKDGNELNLYQYNDIIKSDYEQIIKTGRIDNALRESMVKSGEKRYLIYSTRIINFNGEPCFLSMTIDITETRKIQDQLNQAQKMDAIGKLAGGVAHDFNNMLGGIMGAVELLNLYAENAEKREKYINLIKSTAERAAELTSKLLAFSRKTDVEYIAVDIHKIIEDASLLLHRTIDRKIDVKLDLNADEFVVKGDMSQLLNILLNLGINAGNAMQNGGTLTFSTRNLELDATWCRINSPDITPGRHILVEVRDTGHGIPQESISRIFDPFFTTSEKGKGTGLGLSAVYGNIKQHQGAITVYSEPDRGTVFHIYLPLTGDTVIPSLQSKDLIMGSGVILIIDDEEIMRITAREILQHLGYEVLEAADGREGTDIYRKEYSRIDAVLLDMVMPVMNGDECFRELKAINPDVKVIIASGFLLDQNLEEMKKGGLKSFIRKPYQTAELSRILAGVLSE